MHIECVVIKREPVCDWNSFDCENGNRKLSLFSFKSFSPSARRAFLPFSWLPWLLCSFNLDIGYRVLLLTRLLCSFNPIIGYLILQSSWLLCTMSGGCSHYREVLNFEISIFFKKPIYYCAPEPCAKIYQFTKDISCKKTTSKLYFSLQFYQTK